MTLRFWLAIVPVWCALSVIAGFAWGFVGWAIHRLRIYRAYREYRRFNDETFQQRHLRALRSIAEMGRK